MIDVFGANGFGCLKNVELKLTKLHALVGPNDSGKSTILRGIRTLSALTTDALRANGSNLLGFDPPFDPANTDGVRRPLLWGGTKNQLYRFGATKRAQYVEQIVRGGVADAAKAREPFSATSGVQAPELAGAVIVRWSQTQLRTYSGQLTADAVAKFAESGGAGLPGMFARLAFADPASWLAMQRRVHELFPTITTFGPDPVGSQHLRLAFTVDGKALDASVMSDGVLYFLAFAALEHGGSSPIMLVEEPENGLHPARIAEVIRGLRAITESGKAQVIMATHSPLILNELQPEEVTIVTRTPEQGTRVTPIAETTNFGDRSKAYALGELWLSYCDGRLEEELVPAAKAG